MKHITLLILILFFITSLQVIAQSTPQQMVIRIGRGINLGNVMNAPIEGNWAPAFEETYFQDVADEGFTTARIPIRFNNQTTPLSSVTYTDGNGNYFGSPKTRFKVKLTNNSLDVSNLNNGLYIVKTIYNNNTTTINKLIIHNN